jgi:hypothetical protein
VGETDVFPQAVLTPEDFVSTHVANVETRDRDFILGYFQPELSKLAAEPIVWC